MKNSAFNALENEMINFDFSEIEAYAQSAQESINFSNSAVDIRTQICSVWSKIRRYVKWAEAVPVAGKYITILVNLMDSICPQ